MKKVVLILAAVSLFPMSGWAAFQAASLAESREGPGMPFAVQLSLGVVNGDAKEHVYDYETADGRRRQLSRLDWDLKSVVMGGGSLSVRPLNGTDFWDRFTLNGGLWLALTEGSGEMDDYDWLDVRSSDWTHYSLSDVDVTAGYILDLNAAFDAWATEDFVLRVIAGYKQDGWTWEDRGVYLLYPEYGYVPQFLGGDNMINYEQQFRMPYLGGSADWQWNRFTFSGYLTWSPIVFATDWDEHVARDLHFKETFDGGDMLGFGLEARYAFTEGSFKGLFLTAALDYQAIDLIVGDMEVRNIVTGEAGSEKDVAGIENEYLVISLGGGFRF